MRIIFVVLILLALLTGCMSEKDADRSYNRIASLVETKSFNEAKRELQSFLNKHPEYRREVRFRDLSSKIDSEISRIELEKQRHELELNKFISKKYDVFQKITWYETKRNTDYQEGSHVTFQVELYCGTSDNSNKFFRLRTRYTDRLSDYHDTQWIFYEKIQLLSDNGGEIVVSTNYPNKQSDNGSYGLTEWSDNLLSDFEVLKFATANKIKVRFDGKYRHDFYMNSSQLRAFKEIIEKFKTL